jgi:GNAT superfamily N-acetyltransferase
MAAVQLRPLRPDDLTQAQAISASFGWPHRIEDWNFMLGLGRGWAAERDGKLAGTGLCWAYGEDGGALGMVGVAPGLQGRGIGYCLLERLLAELAGRRVTLHATEAGLRLYESLGFVPAGRVRQHQGAAFRPALIPLKPGERLRPVGRSDPPMLAELDRAAGGMDRRALIAALLKAGTGVVLDKGGTATGFAVLRRFGIGHVIGPVVARDQSGAQALMGHFLAENPGQFIRVDAPEEAGLSAWLHGLGLTEAGVVIRMVGGDGPGLFPSSRVSAATGSFALAGQAFG